VIKLALNTSFVAALHLLTVPPPLLATKRVLPDKASLPPDDGVVFGSWQSDSVSGSLGHSIQNFDSKTLSGCVRWIGEQGLVDGAQRQCQTVSGQQQLASAGTDTAIFQEPF
jgi:hypothetical protein